MHNCTWLRKVSNNGGYDPESNAANIIVQMRRMTGKKQFLATQATKKRRISY